MIRSPLKSSSRCLATGQAHVPVLSTIEGDAFLRIVEMPFTNFSTATIDVAWHLV
jgi:hypothetical protein